MTVVLTEIVYPPSALAGTTSLYGVVYVFPDDYYPSYTIAYAYIPLETLLAYPSPYPEFALAANTIAVIKPAKANNPNRAKSQGAQHVLLYFSLFIGGLTGYL